MVGLFFFSVISYHEPSALTVGFVKAENPQNVFNEYGSETVTHSSVIFAICKVSQRRSQFNDQKILKSVEFANNEIKTDLKLVDSRSVTVQKHTHTFLK